MRSSSCSTSRLCALALLLLVPAAALAQGPARTYAVKEGSTLSYTLIHKLHEVKGTAKRLDGKARLLPDGTLQVAVRARVEDFDSGNSNRDAHMKEATEAARFPLIDFKGVSSGVKAPARLPATVPVTVKGRLTFHGVTRAVEVPLQVTFTKDGQVKADGRFEISLEAFEVERPSLLMVKVQDALVLALALQLAKEGA
jgi:polyisoprenoid-binding protein YceI